MIVYYQSFAAITVEIKLIKRDMKINGRVIK